MSSPRPTPDAPSSVDEPSVAVSQPADDPDVVWERLAATQTVRQVAPLALDTPVSARSVRFVCVSDTHSLIKRDWPVPAGDVFIHAGDFSRTGSLDQIRAFNTFLGTLPHRHKLVIAGNHDIPFDVKFLHDSTARLQRFGLDLEQVELELERAGVRRASDLLTNCTYLEDSQATVYGLRVYGSPWQPLFHNWAFNLPRGQMCLDKWDLIPRGVDVLITHGPPLGHGDYCKSEKRAGCAELLSTVQQRVRPKYHVFGHIHEGYGLTSDGTTTFINACTCNWFYQPKNPPVIFDIDLPEGVTKDMFE